MFHEFMQMGSPAAFAIMAICAGPAVILIVAIVNRTVQRGQQLDHSLKLQQAADMAKQITMQKQTARRVDDG